MPSRRSIPNKPKDEAEKVFVGTDHDAIWRAKNGVKEDAMTQVRNEQARISENIARQKAARGGNKHDSSRLSPK